MQLGVLMDWGADGVFPRSCADALSEGNGAGDIRGDAAGAVAEAPESSPLRAGWLLARATLGSCPPHRLASAIFKAPV